MLRQHLEYLRKHAGMRCRAIPALIAAAMGGMLSMLAYALLPDESRCPSLWRTGLLGHARSWTPSPTCCSVASQAPPTDQAACAPK